MRVVKFVCLGVAIVAMGCGNADEFSALTIPELGQEAGLEAAPGGAGGSAGAAPEAGLGGQAGSPVEAGTGGASGSPEDAGIDAEAGADSGGAGGTAGTAGTGGNGGATGGSAGTGGAGGATGGSSGTGGTGGSTGGSAGSSGTGGTGGTSGAGGSAGTGGSAGSAGAGGSPPVCTPGVHQCLGTVARTCDAQGQWTEIQCPFLCTNGVCSGVCTNGTMQCVGKVLQTCTSGAWVDTQTCPDTCSNGVCMGPCTPGSKDCNGSIPRTCDAQGNWVSFPACQNSACVAGACIGTCSPGSKQCSGSTIQTCDANGSWVNGSSCASGCTNGACNDCNPGSIGCNGLIAQTCDTQGHWQTSQTCPFVCLNGTCTGVCQPGVTQCQGNVAQTCNNVGVWQTTATCPYACLLGTCTGVCVPGSKQCVGLVPQTCDSLGQWQSATTCSDPGNSTPSCTAGVCGYGCNSGYGDCDSITTNGCEAAFATDPLNCASCGHSCLGGACVAGKCQPATLFSFTAPPYIAIYGLEVDATSLYWVAGQVTGALYKGPNSGGTANVLASLANPVGLALSSTDVYYDGTDAANFTRVNRVSKAGGTPTLLGGANGQASSHGIKIDTTNVYWTNMSDGTVRKTPLGGGPTTTLASGEVSASTEAISATTVYFRTGCNLNPPFCTTPWLIRAVPIGGGAAITAVTPTKQPMDLAVDGGYLYWIEQSAGIKRMLISNSSIETVYSGPAPSRLAFDATHVYWTENTGGYGYVRRIPKTGGTVEDMTSTIGRTYEITLDAGFVYWTWENGAGTITEIRRVAK